MFSFFLISFANAHFCRETKSNDGNRISTTACTAKSINILLHVKYTRKSMLDQLLHMEDAVTTSYLNSSGLLRFQAKSIGVKK